MVVNMNYKKIHIGAGWYGLHNIGDDAVLKATVDNFSGDNNKVSVTTFKNDYMRKFIENVEFDYITTCYEKPNNGMYISRRNLVPSLKRLINEKKMYRNADLFIAGGGSTLTDCGWHSLRVINIAIKSGVNTIIFGPGMGTLKDEKLAKFLVNTCNKLEDIYVRDEYVKERLLNLGVHSNKVKVCYDPALTIKENININLKLYLSEEQIQLYNDNNINIAITLAGESDIINPTPINDLNVLIEYWRKKYNANIFLIPTNISNGMDLDVMRKLDLSDNVILLEKEFTPSDLVNFMGNMKFVLSSRLHMNILSSIKGTPSIGLVRNEKIINFANILGLNYYSLDKPEINDIKDYSDYLITNNDTIRYNIINKVNYMRQVHFEAVETVKNKYLNH